MIMLSLEPKVAWAVMWEIINYPTKQLEHKTYQNVPDQKRQKSLDRNKSSLQAELIIIEL